MGHHAAVGRYITGQKERAAFRTLVDSLQAATFEEACRAYLKIEKANDPSWRAALGICDRYYLLTMLMGRHDGFHPWLYARCREVEAEPWECLDLWAREHYKSTILTFTGSIQEIIRDPEVTIGIFSHTKDISEDFVEQIKTELQDNALLKALYPDVLWLDPKKQAPKWSNSAIIVKRKRNPREATVESWGLVDGQPTGKHFKRRFYDDVVTLKSISNATQVRKTTIAFEMSDNLGSHGGTRAVIGTRYHFADTYQNEIDKGQLKQRIYPATDNGRLDGNPVFLTPEAWAAKKISQARVIAAQMLQNPTAGEDTMFELSWLAGKQYEIRPQTLNIYILVDPNHRASASQRTDRTAMAVIGVDANLNKYLLDGFRHRMDLSERWANLKNLHRHWKRQPGIRSVRVGYERYGQQSDIQAIEMLQQKENARFPIEEVAWPREGGASKEDRVGRLVPDFRKPNFFLPATVYVPGVGACTWNAIKEGDSWIVVKTPLKGDTTLQRRMKEIGTSWRNAKPIMRKDESKDLYDLTVDFIEEFEAFNFGAHDDLIDCCSRIYDMKPVAPKVSSRVDLGPVFVDT